MHLGCDEAGRGPVLGSMFVACVVAQPEQLPDGVQDSKQLTTPTIHRLATQIRDRATTVAVVEVTADDIDQQQSLTALSLDAYQRAIQHGGAASCETGYIDAFTRNREQLTTQFTDAFPAVEWVVEFDADNTYPIVSAASIIAKSEREHHIDTVSERYGDIGSGYPSDPTTQQFLDEYIAAHDEPPPIARRTWSTIEDRL